VNQPRPKKFTMRDHLADIDEKEATRILGVCKYRFHEELTDPNIEMEESLLVKTIASLHWALRELHRLKKERRVD
jgi:hypothetical protein